MIGSLVKFSSVKRELYFPNASRYSHFDGRIGLVTGHTVDEVGEQFVEIRWVKPWKWMDRIVTESSFNLLNFEIVSK